MQDLVLVSHPLCPYVQRAAIVMLEKKAPFERVDIDLANKPPWFLEVSPLGKTPVLLVGKRAIFESAVICEYLEESFLPRLHPQQPLDRAEHRAWMAFGSTVLDLIAGFYSATDDQTLKTKADGITAKFQQIELARRPAHFFAGDDFSIVDAVFAPVFRYFDAFEAIGDFGFFDRTPLVSRWREALQQRPSVIAAVRTDYPELLRQFLLKRNSALSRKMIQS
jgi:glutathione S-transferase